MKFRITKISKNFYSFSIWDKCGELLLVYTGNENTITRRAKELGYDPSLKMSILNSDKYDMGYIQ